VLPSAEMTSAVPAGGSLTGRDDRTSGRGGWGVSVPPGSVCLMTTTTDDGSSAAEGETEFRHSTIAVGDSSLHVIEAGPDDGPAVVFLHGWPQSSAAWRLVMRRAVAEGYRAVAIDLPGVGGSTGEATDGSTEAIAAVVHDLLGTLALENVTLVGHDLGGMTAYSYLRRFDDASRTVIMDTVVPGVAPWEQVLANPYVWHFAFHSIPGLPELLVQGKQREYFDFFFNVLSPEQSGVSSEARDGYAQAYASDEALHTGFNWYRMLRQDAADNASATGPITSPLLYLRGEHEGGDLDSYVAGFRQAGLADVRSARIPGAGHFAPDDAPDAVWAAIADFIIQT